MASQAARLAGRGAFTAAAVMAVAGGTASMAFAQEAPTAHEVQGTLADGAHELSHGAQKLDTDSVKGHGEKLRHEAKDVAASLKESAPSSSLEKLPVADMVADTGHAVDHAKNDATHAKHNWSAAAQDGLTADEVREQVGLMGDDVAHAADNGRNDLAHWGGKLSSAAPAGLDSVLSFS
ncbi:hypothetical protein WCD74_12795 [Actinomycetospora sp. OC33-EN08]|uniref:DUF4142 domain-containing protein n=1 Tax=Actinomycetospora aurantiaca TaxID=3129233 RepID=A0ABU8MPY6_9PSEU